MPSFAGVLQNCRCLGDKGLTFKTLAFEYSHGGQFTLSPNFCVSLPTNAARSFVRINPYA